MAMETHFCNVANKHCSRCELDTIWWCLWSWCAIQSAHAWKKPQAYHRDHVQGFAMFSQNEPYSECQYYFFADETYSNVQPFRTEIHKHISSRCSHCFGTKTFRTEIHKHISSRCSHCFGTKTKTTGISDCRHLQFHWSSMMFSTVRRNRSSGGFNQFRSEKLVPYIYIVIYLLFLLISIFIYCTLCRYIIWW